MSVFASQTDCLLPHASLACDGVDEDSADYLSSIDDNEFATFNLPAPSDNSAEQTHPVPASMLVIDRNHRRGLDVLGAAQMQSDDNHTVVVGNETGQLLRVPRSKHRHGREHAHVANAPAPTQQQHLHQGQHHNHHRHNNDSNDDGNDDGNDDDVYLPTYRRGRSGRRPKRTTSAAADVEREALEDALGVRLDMDSSNGSGSSDRSDGGSAAVNVRGRGGGHEGVLGSGDAEAHGMVVLSDAQRDFVSFVDLDRFKRLVAQNEPSHQHEQPGMCERVWVSE